MIFLKIVMPHLFVTMNPMVKDFYQKYHSYLPAAFFLAGFLFDLLTLGRIDQALSLLQQLAYIFIIMLLMYWEVHTPKRFLMKGTQFQKIWKYHKEAMHFLFGGLLSIYTIFYFKSASLLNSFLFIAFLATILMINELPRLQKVGLVARSALLGLCISSYFVYLVPVISGTIGVWTFLMSMAISISLYQLFNLQILKKKEDDIQFSKKLVLPGLIVQIIFVFLYFVKILPPVPLSLKHIGIYHKVERGQDEYLLQQDKPWWAFWRSGSQVFSYQAGDKVYCAFSIFSPAQFKEQIFIQWSFLGKNGWKDTDQIPVAISGGRDQGFRGFAYKSNIEMGDWKVKVLTSDGREIGRIYFEVHPSDGNSRTFKTLRL
jgi:hypothetical protein